MYEKALAIVICLLTLAGPPTVALAQCTDSDSDGYFHQPDCGTLEDCNDAAPAVHPAALELCDGYDSDCDGLIDNDPACTTSCPAPYQAVGSLTTITATPDHNWYPSLAWTGSEYGVAWQDDSTGEYRIRFARLDAMGNKIGSEIDAGPGTSPSLVWTGTEFAVAYRLHPTGLFFQRLDASGNPIGGASHIAQTGYSPSVAWTGSEYGLAWTNGTTQDSYIVFARVDASGQFVPDSQVIVSRTGLNWPETAFHPDLAWNGVGFGLVYGLTEWVVGFFWKDDVYFQALDSAGNLIGETLDLTGAVDPSIESLEPEIAWSGSEFGLAWHNGAYIRFARVDGSGNRIGSTVNASDPFDQVLWPDLTWTGGEYGLSWYGWLQPAIDQVFFTRLDPSGSALGDDVQVTDVHGADVSAIVWNGAEYGLAWQGVIGSEDDPGVYFTRLACGPCIDHDGDDATNCDDCDDGDDFVYPGALQLCDGINNDCDDVAWPEVPADEIDADSDTYRPCSGDCDESDPARHPGATEFCDEIDNDCSGEADDADLDADGVRDCGDNCLGISNPVQFDPDSDGVGDLCDLCPFVPDPDQADMDGDGRGDACDCQPIDPGDREPEEVGGLLIGPIGADSWLLEWAAAPGADAYSISRGNLATLGPDSYGDCLVQGVSALSFEDSAAPAPGAGLFYLLQGQNFDCGLGPLGWTSEEQPRLNPGAGACDGHPHTDLHAANESSVYGTISGSYTDTFASDDVSETVEEELSSGNPDIRFSHLEHRWTLDVTAGSRIEIHVEGHRTASSDGDDFRFEYSTDGGTSWNPIALAPLPLGEYGSDSVADLPASLSGVVIFRVIDSDRTAGNQALDSVYIDELFVRVIP